MKKHLIYSLAVTFALSLVTFAPAPAQAGDIVKLGLGAGGGQALKDATNGNTVAEVFPRGWTCGDFASATPTSATSSVVSVSTVAAASSDYYGPYLVKLQNTSAVYSLGYYLTTSITPDTDASTVKGQRLAIENGSNAGSRADILVANTGQYLHLRGVTATAAVDYCVCHLDD